MKIEGAKVRVVKEKTVSELYVSFPTPENFDMSSGKYDVTLVPSSEQVKAEEPKNRLPKISPLEGDLQKPESKQTEEKE